jgi:hypothetical protein
MRGEAAKVVPTAGDAAGPVLATRGLSKVY